MAVREIDDVDFVAPETAGVKKKIKMETDDGDRYENGRQPNRPTGKNNLPMMPSSSGNSLEAGERRHARTLDKIEPANSNQFAGFS